MVPRHTSLALKSLELARLQEAKVPASADVAGAAAQDPEKLKDGVTLLQCFGQSVLQRKTHASNVMLFLIS